MHAAAASVVCLSRSAALQTERMGQSLEQGQWLQVATGGAISGCGRVTGSCSAEQRCSGCPLQQRAVYGQPMCGTRRTSHCLQELNDRDRFLQVLLEKYQQASAAAAAGAEQQQQQQPGALMAAAAAATAGGVSKAAQATGLPVNAVSSGPPLLLDEAVAVIIRNERGRQVSLGLLIMVIAPSTLRACTGCNRGSTACSFCSCPANLLQALLCAQR